MAFKRLISAAAAAALIFSPTIAAAQSSAPVAAVSNGAVEPAAESADGSALRRTGIIIPFAAILLIGLVVYLLTKKGDGGEPVSP